MDSESLGEKIYKLRKSRKISQEELGFQLGITRQTISKWELNTMTPATDNIKALCKFFNVGVDYFLSDSVNIEEHSETVCAVDSASSEENNSNNIADNFKKRKILWLIAIIIDSAILSLSIIVTVIVGIIVSLPQDGIEVVSAFKIKPFVWITCLVINLIAFAILIFLIIIKKRLKCNV